MADRIVTVFGASGLLGRHLVQELAREGWRIRAAVRRPHLAQFLRPSGGNGQVQPVQANIRDEASIRAAIAGANAVVNLVGVLSERGKQNFRSLHEEGAALVAKIATEQGITHFIHTSAIGADESSSSLYSASKARGEARVCENFPGAVIVRPSVVFAIQDRFLNLFAAIARLSPIVPLFGGGATRLQPVYAGDVAKAMVRLLNEDAPAGTIYEFGGPQVMTLREVWEFVLRATGRKRILLSIPFSLAEIAALFLGLLPKPPLTRDQIRLLKTDNVVSSQAISEGRTLEGLGIVPNALHALAPAYLARFRRAGEFDRASAVS